MLVPSLVGTIVTITCFSERGNTAEPTLSLELVSKFQTNGLAIIRLTNRHWTAFVFGQNRYIEHDVPIFLYSNRITSEGNAIVGDSGDGETFRLTLDGNVTGVCQIPIGGGSVSLSPAQNNAVVVGRRFVTGHKNQTVERGVFLVSGLWGKDISCQPLISPLQIGAEDEIPAAFSWSPDEGFFTFGSGGQVLVYDIADHAAKSVAEGGSPRWSPDGKWISFRGPQGEAFLVNPSTGERRALLLGRPIRGPLHWSPDSRLLFFTEMSPMYEQLTDGASVRFVAYRLSDGATQRIFGAWDQVNDSLYDWGYVPEALRH